MGAEEGNGAADPTVERAVRPSRSKRPPGTAPPRKRQPRKSRSARDVRRETLRRIAWLGAEVSALCAVGVLGVIAGLGRFAEWFAGAGLWANLVPFAAAVLGLAVVTAGLLRLWLLARGWLAPRASWLPGALALALAAGATALANHPAFRDDLDSLRILVGGQAEAERIAIAHQVYATYRRADPAVWRRMLERARAYEAVIQEAAATFDVDAEVLMGLAATESSFVPRTSKDGGRGLFQLTALPTPAVEAAQRALGVKRIDPLDHRHNAFAAAATLRRYLDDVGNDLFLGLLAYNMGPHNGGLRSIMEQYGARDFVTIQPYLQLLPRDYPIRVLAAALAYRLWHADGRLPRYEDGDNARQIQEVGIPGFAPEPLPVLHRPRPSS